MNLQYKYIQITDMIYENKTKEFEKEIGKIRIEDIKKKVKLKI